MTEVEVNELEVQGMSSRKDSKAAFPINTMLGEVQILFIIIILCLCKCTQITKKLKLFCYLNLLPEQMLKRDLKG